MNYTKNKLNIFRMIFVIICILILIFCVKNAIKTLKNISKICIVEKGTLKFEERTEGYILRDEVVLNGENYKNGMVTIISEGQKVAKDRAVFRYYSNGEENTLAQIDTLDNEIDAAIESSGLTIFSTDIANLENQIEKKVDLMYQINDLEEIRDKISELNTYISKKTKITGDLSPADSRVKTLIDQRNQLEGLLSNASEMVKSPKSGMVSYRIDGLEEILGVSDFSYLNVKFLKDLNIKTSAIIPISTEKGKIVNNFECYIACPMDTEKSSVAKVGDKVKLKLISGNEIDAEIVYITETENDERIIVFKIKDEIKDLLQFRKINVDVIWWSYGGLKLSNSAIQEENDLCYVEKNKAGYKEKIYVKVLRQNDTYSIVENYTNDELIELGVNSENIEEQEKLSVYDEIVLH